MSLILQPNPDGSPDDHHVLQVNGRLAESTNGEKRSGRKRNGLDSHKHISWPQWTAFDRNERYA